MLVCQPPRPTAGGSAVVMTPLTHIKR
eukprot:SAG25_NODE_14326_length_256_cov_0.662420_1_plen_26_part_01